MICPEKKWRELSSFLITSGYVNALNSHGQLEAFWNLSVMGCVGEFITESLLLSLNSSQKGGAGLGRRFTHGRVLTVLLKMCIFMTRARRVNSTVTFHLCITFTGERRT